MKITMYPFSKSFGIELNERELKMLNTTGKIVRTNDQITFLERNASFLDKGNVQVRTLWTDKVSGKLCFNNGETENEFDIIHVKRDDEKHKRVKGIDTMSDFSFTGTPQAIENTLLQNISIKENWDLREYCSRVWDSSNQTWDKYWYTKIDRLEDLESKFNRQLHNEGHVFLNDVYDALGFSKTKLGQIVGWLYNDGCSEVKFEIYDVDGSAPKMRVGCPLKIVFNVSGVIIDKI